MTIPVNDVFSGLGLSAASLNKPEKEEMGKEDFMTLLVTQLKNQDPLKPLESQDFLAQLAQFSTVSGIESLNTSFNQLATSLASGQALQAAALVGDSVLAPGSTAVFNGTAPVSGAVDLPAGASQVTVEVLDGTGAVRRTLTLGPQSAGLASFSWDGATADGTAAPAGEYTVRARAVIAGKTEAVETLVAARVDSVTLDGADGLVLNLAGLGATPFTDVRQILSSH